MPEESVLCSTRLTKRECLWHSINKKKDRHFCRSFVEEIEIAAAYAFAVVAASSRAARLMRAALPLKSRR